MPLYGITAIHTDATGMHIERVRWAPIDGSRNAWLGPVEESEAHAVADALAGGDTVYAIFTTDGGLTIPGVRARYIELPGGREGIGSVDPELHPRRTLLDLPRF